MPLAKLHAALAALDARTEVRRGTPATPAQIEAIARKTGCQLPDDYRAFLAELGSLHLVTPQAASMYDDVCVLGHAPGDAALDISAASKSLADEYDRWGQAARPSAPLIAFFGEGHGSECVALDDKGGVVRFWRGQIEPRQVSFVDAVLDELEQLRASLAEHDAAAATAAAEAARLGVLDRLLPLLPPALSPQSDKQGSRHRIVVTRPADGVQIELRSGKAKHVGDHADAVFVLWKEPPVHTFETMNAWNQQAWFVRGSVAKEGARFRGRLLGADLAPELLLHLLAHDAGSPVPAQAQAPPRLEDVEAVLRTAPVEDATDRLFSTLMRKTSTPAPAPSVRREGDELVFLALPRKKETETIELRARVHASGLVELRHHAQVGGDVPGALVAASDVNSTRWPEGDQFFDAEIFVRATVDAPRVTFSVTTPLSAIVAGHHRLDVLGLQKVVTEATFLERGDERSRRHAEVAQSTGLTIGPVGAFVIDMLDAGAFGTRARPRFDCIGRKKQLDSEWGEVQLFLQTSEASPSPAWEDNVHLDVGWAVAPGRSSDDAPIVGVPTGGSEVRPLAANLRDWLSAFLLGAVGYQFHGDADRSWRDHRAAGADVGPFRRLVDDARRLLGIEPPPDPGALLARAPAPPPPRAQTSRSFTATATGEATLAAVDALIRESWTVERHPASHPDKKALHKRMKAIKPKDAAEALETWIARRRDALEVRCGTPDKKPDASLHPLHKALLQRFGFLELRIASDQWPYRRHSDGLRILGDAPGDPDCDLGWQRAQYQRALEPEAGLGKHSKDDREKLAALTPLLTWLEGMHRGWAASTTKCEPVHSLPQSSNEMPHDFRDVTHPRLGPSFALLAQVMLIDRRIDELAEWRAVASMLGSETPVVDAAGRLVLGDDRRVRITLEGYRQQLARVAAATAVLVTCEVVRGPTRINRTPDAALEKRVADLAPHLRGASMRIHDGDVLAEASVLRAGMGAEDLRLAVAAVRHAAAQFGDPSLPPFDEVPIDAPPEALAICREAGADAAGYDARFLQKSAMPPRRSVTFVGQAFPRVRWWYATPPDGHAGTAGQWRKRPDGAAAVWESELSCASLSPARIEAVMAQMPLRDRAASPRGYTPDDAKQVQAEMLAAAEATQALLKREPVPPLGKEAWRSMAAAAPVSDDELRRFLSAHSTWQARNPQRPRGWKPYSFLDTTIGVHVGGDAADQPRFGRRDLRGRDLRGAMLTSANLVHLLGEGVDFAGANLEDAFLCDGDLRGACFDGAALRGADFSRCDLRGARFVGADGTGTDFEGCDLTGCDFGGAKLEGVKLAKAVSPPEVPT